VCWWEHDSRNNSRRKALAQCHVFTDRQPLAGLQPDGAALQLAAQNVGSSYSYDTGCLAAPAGTPLTIAFDNQSPEVSHNVEILDHPGGTPLFTGKLLVGPKTVTYKVKALEAGTYSFHCTVHPTRMNGDLVVGG
jgi:plastocyanin